MKYYTFNQQLDAVLTEWDPATFIDGEAQSSKFSWVETPPFRADSVFLVLDVTLKDFHRRTTARGCEEARSPEARGA